MKISLLAKLIAAGRNDVFLFHFQREPDISHLVVAGNGDAEYLSITSEALGSILSTV